MHRAPSLHNATVERRAARPAARRPSRVSGSARTPSATVAALAAAASVALLLVGCFPVVPALSPDGELVAIVRDSSTGWRPKTVRGAGERTPGHDLYLTNRDATRVVRVTDFGVESQCRFPAWGQSPDDPQRQALCFVGRWGGEYVRHITNSDHLYLVEDAKGAFGRPGDNFVTASPLDAETARRDYPHVSRQAVQRVYTASDADSHIVFPVFSPDGSKIAFIETTHDPNWATTRDEVGASVPGPDHVARSSFAGRLVVIDLANRRQHTPGESVASKLDHLRYHNLASARVVVESGAIPMIAWRDDNTLLYMERTGADPDDVPDVAARARWTCAAQLIKRDLRNADGGDDVSLWSGIVSRYLVSIDVDRASGRVCFDQGVSNVPSSTYVIGGRRGVDAQRPRPARILAGPDDDRPLLTARAPRFANDGRRIVWWETYVRADRSTGGPALDLAATPATARFVSAIRVPIPFAPPLFVVVDRTGSANGRQQAVFERVDPAREMVVPLDARNVWVFNKAVQGDFGETVGVTSRIYEQPADERDAGGERGGVGDGEGNRDGPENGADEDGQGVDGEHDAGDRGDDGASADSGSTASDDSNEAATTARVTRLEAELAARIDIVCPTVEKLLERARAAMGRVGQAPVRNSVLALQMSIYTREQGADGQLERRERPGFYNELYQAARGDTPAMLRVEENVLDETVTTWNGQVIRTAIPAEEAGFRELDPNAPGLNRGPARQEARRLIYQMTLRRMLMLDGIDNVGGSADDPGNRVGLVGVSMMGAVFDVPFADAGNPNAPMQLRSFVFLKRVEPVHDPFDPDERGTHEFIMFFDITPLLRDADDADDPADSAAEGAYRLGMMWVTSKGWMVDAGASRGADGNGGDGSGVSQMTLVFREHGPLRSGTPGRSPLTIPRRLDAFSGYGLGFAELAPADFASFTATVLDGIDPYALGGAERSTLESGFNVADISGCFTKLRRW